MTKFWVRLMALALLVGCNTKTAGASEESAAEEPAAAVEEAAPEASGVAATVDGVEIPMAEVERLLQAFVRTMGSRVPPTELEEVLPAIRAHLLEQLVQQQVMLAAAQAEGVDLTDEEMQEVIDEINSELDEGRTVEDFLAESGMTMDDVRSQMRIRKHVMQKAEAVPEPSDEEIQAFYDENGAALEEDAAVTASHILIKVEPTATEEEKAAALEKIQGLREEILGGADFAEVATANSDCPSRIKGGDLGTFGRGMMVPEFEDAAFTQEIGVVGDVVKTQFGYHLILVTDRHDARRIPLEEVKDRISGFLRGRAQSEAVEAYVDGLMEAADIQILMEMPEDGEDEADAEEEAIDLTVEEDIVVEEEPVAEEAPVAVEEAPAEDAPAEEAAPAAEEAPEAA